MYKRITIALAVLGLGFAVYIVATAKETIPAPEPAYPPSINPFGKGIVALGLVESAKREIQLAAPEPGRVQEVLVDVGASVKAGDRLFSLDTSALEAELVRASGLREAAAAELARQQAWPRPEDLPPLEAAVSEAKARVDDTSDRLRTLSQAEERSAATSDEVTRQRFLAQLARASLARAQAELDKYRAGPWSQDVAVARAKLAAEEAHLASIRKQIERLVVRAPIDGTVLKRNIEPGEYIQAAGGGNGSSSMTQSAMVIGDLSQMRVRAQVDEEDMPLLTLGSRAVARVRGGLNRERAEIPLTMLWIEPLAGPKRQITNASTELVDTRVVDVMFSIAPESLKDVAIYPGQVVDVYIESGKPASKP